jgi:serine/threonine protein kinase
MIMDFIKVLKDPKQYKHKYKYIDNEIIIFKKNVDFDFDNLEFFGEDNIYDLENKFVIKHIKHEISCLKDGDDQCYENNFESIDFKKKSYFIDPQYYREYQFFRDLNNSNLKNKHKHIVKLKKLIFIPDKEYFVITEKLGTNRNTLENNLIEKKINNVNQILDISLQIAKAMKVVHSMGYVYGDLKDDNIIITDNEVVKLIDFGWSHNLKNFETHIFSRIVMKYMRPPEVPYKRIDDDMKIPQSMIIKDPKAVDIWTLGHVMLEMFAVVYYGHKIGIDTYNFMKKWNKVFRKGSDKKVDSLLKKILNFPNNENIKLFFKQIFEKNYLKRLNIEEVIQSITNIKTKIIRKRKYEDKEIKSYKKRKIVLK